MPLSKRRKLHIFNRDSGLCQYCGQECKLEDVNQWHVDHVKSIANGGDNHGDNLKLACASCNSRKSGYPLDYFRGMMAINASPYKGVINYKQALALLNLNVQLDLPKFIFHFEANKA